MPHLGLKGDCGISAATPAEHVIYIVFCIADCCLIAGKSVIMPLFASPVFSIQTVHSQTGATLYSTAFMDTSIPRRAFVGYFPFGHNIIGGSLFDIFFVLGKHLGEKICRPLQSQIPECPRFCFPKSALLYKPLLLHTRTRSLQPVWHLSHNHGLCNNRSPLQARIQCYIILPCLHRMLRASGKQGQQYAYKQKG